MLNEVYVFDSSAVLAILANEPGSDYAITRLEGALISSVNLIEVVTRLVDWGYSTTEISAMLSKLEVRVVDLTETQALVAGHMRKVTRAKGLSLGDRACLAAGYEGQHKVLTADRAWADIDVGVVVEFIRA